jgi:hypothetical protein
VYLFNVFLSGCSATSFGGGLYDKFDHQRILGISGNVVFSSCTSQYGGGIFLNDANNGRLHFGKHLSFIDCVAEIGEKIVIQSLNFVGFFSSSSWDFDFDFDSYLVEGQDEFLGYDGLSFLDISHYLCFFRFPCLFFFFFFVIFFFFFNSYR